MPTPTKKSDIPLRTRFAHNVRSIRVEKGVSQEELALLAGLHRTFVSDVEREVRNLSIDNIERLAKALAVDAAELFRPVLRMSEGLPIALPKGPRRNRGSAS